MTNRLNMWGEVMLGGVMAMVITPQAVAAASTLEEALTGGEVLLDVRYRYEHVDQDNSLENADASTVRSRLGYGTEPFYGVSGYLELENITSVGPQYYNSGTNGKAAYSVVTDPVGSQVDQAYLAWNAPADTLVRLGRQVINLDNQRFIGRVDWRQNGQTFDAVSLVNRTLPDTVVTYAYLRNVDRITAATTGMNSNLLNARYSGLAAGILSGYAYLLNYDTAPSQSTQTYGLRFTGGTAVGTDKKVMYTAEFAKQSAYANNPASYTLNYVLAEIGGTVSGVTAKVGYEVLGSNGAYSVQTPLATLHAFDGWAEQFLTIPTAGLEDTYIGVGGSVMDVDLQVVYHDFRPNKGGGDFGTEWDAQAVKKIGKLFSITAEYASFNAGNVPGKVDTDKLWLMGQVAF